MSNPHSLLNNRKFLFPIASIVLLLIIGTPIALWLARTDDGGVRIEVHPADEFPGEDPATALPAALSAALKGLAHEIRNPLAGMKGAAQLLARRAAQRDASERELIDLAAQGTSPSFTVNATFPGGAASTRTVTLTIALGAPTVTSAATAASRTSPRKATGRRAKARETGIRRGPFGARGWQRDGLSSVLSYAAAGVSGCNRSLRASAGNTAQ